MTAQEFLESLGSTTEDVITSLENMGVKGRRHHCYDCVIAKALQQGMNDGYDYIVGATNGFRCEPGSVRWNERFDLPKPVETVRRMFDAGELEQFNETLI